MWGSFSIFKFYRTGTSYPTLIEHTDKGLYCLGSCHTLLGALSHQGSEFQEGEYRKHEKTLLHI